MMAPGSDQEDPVFKLGASYAVSEALTLRALAMDGRESVSIFETLLQHRRARCCAGSFTIRRQWQFQAYGNDCLCHACAT
jgi:hypothetical protein